jgi:DNA modification methylase
MKIETWPIKNVKPYPANPRVNDGAVDAVAKSIEAFGFRQPIVVDKDGVVIAGHTRLKAAEKLGMIVVPVHVASDMGPDKVRGYRLADNRTAELSEWDFDLLVTEIKALEELGLDTSLLCWDAAELAELFAQETVGLVDEDEIPEPPDEPVTRAGELIVLGNHRLFCGNSGSTEHVDILLDGAVIDLVNTDPPYNVRVEPRSNNAIAAGNSSFKGAFSGHQQGADLQRHPEKAKGTSKKMRAKDRPLANDFPPDDEFEQCLHDWFGTIERVLKPGGAFYIWGGYANIANYPAALKAHQLYMSQTIIWDKQHPVLTRKDFMGAHEWAFYGWREGAGHTFYGPSNVPDLWAVKKVTPQAMVHLTEKPVELARRAIEYSSKPGERVLDLFGGSGSTLIACEQTGRKAYLMELDCAYCDVIVSRWESFTGKRAERVSAVETS